MMRQSLIERLMNSEMAQQLLAQEAAEILAQRRSLVEELAKITAEHEAALPPLVEAAEKAQAKLRAAQERLKPLEEAARATAQARMGTSSSYDFCRGQLECELQASAPEAISDFWREMDILFDKVRREVLPLPLSRQEGKPPWDRPSDADVRASQEPSRQRNERLEKIRDAQREAEALKLEALTAEELGERLADLRRSVDGELEARGKRG